MQSKVARNITEEQEPRSKEGHLATADRRGADIDIIITMILKLGANHDGIEASVVPGIKKNEMILGVLGERCD